MAEKRDSDKKPDSPSNEEPPKTQEVSTRPVETLKNLAFNAVLESIGSNPSEAMAVPEGGTVANMLGTSCAEYHYMAASTCQTCNVRVCFHCMEFCGKCKRIFCYVCLTAQPTRKLCKDCSATHAASQRKM